MPKMQKLAATLGALAAAGVMLWSPAASAQADVKDNTPRGVVTLAEITITGRIQKPIAAVDVARIRPKLTLSELRQPFLERIGNAIYREPF